MRDFELEELISMLSLMKEGALEVIEVRKTTEMWKILDNQKENE